jgi:hypothetical protein
MFFAQTQEWTAFGAALMGDLQAQFRAQGFAEGKVSLVIFAPANFGAAGFAHRPSALFGPAGLAAPFHMVHGLGALQTGRPADPPADIERALREMVLWPSDSAANYVIDWLTGTTGDTPLEGAEYLDWAAKRARLDRFFWQLGWPEWAGCRLVQKLGIDLRYGREAALAGAYGEGLNAISAACAARLLWEMFEGDLPLDNSYLRRAQNFMARDATSPEAVFPNFQLAGFLGGGLPEGVKLWSKSTAVGWTGEARTAWLRHDMLRISARGMRPLSVVLLTQSRAIHDTGEVLFPAIGKMIWDRAVPLLRQPAPPQPKGAPQ